MILRNCLKLLSEISKIEAQIENLESKMGKRRLNPSTSKEVLIRRYLEKKMKDKN